MTTPMDHVRLAAANDSGLYLTQRDAEELADYLSAQDTDIVNLREANEDWADTCADTRDELRRLKTYTVGALRAYAKDRRRLIAERDQAVYGAKVWKQEADDSREELEGLRAYLDDFGWGC